MVNKLVHRALEDYLQEMREDYLFLSRTTKAPLTIQAVNAMVKKWTKMIKLRGTYSREDFRVRAAHTVWCGLRGSGQAVQPLEPRDRHAVSWSYRRRGQRSPDE